MSEWTDTRVELLKRLWAEGQSAGDIANRLGGVTRNSVIGKIHRMKLTRADGINKRNSRHGSKKARANGNNPPPQRKRERRRDRHNHLFEKPSHILAGILDVEHVEHVDESYDLRELPTFHAEPVPETIAADDPGPGERVALVDLKVNSCRWPLGDPREPDFGFCGEPKQMGSPYCTRHHRIAYVGVPVRSRKKFSLPTTERGGKQYTPAA